MHPMYLYMHLMYLKMHLMHLIMHLKVYHIVHLANNVLRHHINIMRACDVLHAAHMHKLGGMTIALQ